MSFSVIIPARYNSSRLPAKLLLDIAGKSILERAYQQATISCARRVIIATDDERIAKVASQFHAEVCMTDSKHQSGTDRLQEVAEKFAMDDDEIIVNLQGDEPFMPATIINQVAHCLASEKKAQAATLSISDLSKEQIFDPNVVKVVTDKEGYALYFSRAPIPWNREEFSKTTKAIDSSGYRRHIGIYAYRASLLNKFVTWPQSPLEKIECLEQLRILWQGHSIFVAQAYADIPAGIDTQEDYQKACEWALTNGI